MVGPVLLGLVFKQLHCSKYLFFRIVLPGIIIGVICYMALEAIEEIQQLQALSGQVVFILGLYVTSKHPSNVSIS